MSVIYKNVSKKCVARTTPTCRPVTWETFFRAVQKTLLASQTTNHCRPLLTTGHCSDARVL